MKNPPDIPQHINELTAEWLRRALVAGGNCHVPKIRDVSVQQIGAGVGMVGTLLRCTLTYDEPTDAAPATVIVKIPSADDNTRLTARRFGLYQREFAFYRFLSSVAPVRSPDLLYGDFDADTHNFVLVLEDLGHLTAADQIQGASERQAMAAVQAAARLHGRFWGRVDQPPVSEVYQPTTPERHGIMQAVYQASLPRVLELFGDQFPDSMRRLAEAYGVHLVEHSMIVADGPQTFVHGDFRLDNMFFDSANDLDVALVDWQVSNIGSGLYDIAYFLSCSISTEMRREIERDAIRQYHEIIAAMNPRMFTLEECWRTYRRNMLGCFRVLVIAGAQLDLTNERSQQLAPVFLQRTLAAIDDLNAAEFLPGGL